MIGSVLELLTYIILSPLFIALLLLYVFLCGSFGLLIFGVFGLEKIFMFLDEEEDVGAGGLVVRGVWFKWQFWVCVLVGILATYSGFIIDDRFGGLYAIGFVLSPLLLIFLKMKLFEIIIKLFDKNYKEDDDL